MPTRIRVRAAKPAGKNSKGTEVQRRLRNEGDGETMERAKHRKICSSTKVAAIVLVL